MGDADGNTFSKQGMEPQKVVLCVLGERRRDTGIQATKSIRDSGTVVISRGPQ